MSSFSHTCFPIILCKQFSMRISIFFYLNALKYKNTKGLGHICVHQRYIEEMPFHIIEENLDYFCAFLAVLNMKTFYHRKATTFFHTLEHALEPR